jgi:uncharacterized protein YeaO (DUF488 family)
MAVFLKRIYDPPATADGKRVLVDRVWPRGVTKDEAKLDLWLKDVAPSTALRKWFGHDPARWPAFRERYRLELADNPALDTLKTLARAKGRLTLLYAARDTQHNQAVVLRELLAAADADGVRLQRPV